MDKYGDMCIKDTAFMTLNTRNMAINNVLIENKPFQANMFHVKEINVFLVK